MGSVATPTGTVLIPDALDNGALPTVYDPVWQSYSAGLTAAQAFAFQSFPQDLVKYAMQRRWLAEISGVNINGIVLTTQDRDQLKIASMKQAFDTGVISSTPFSDAAGNWHLVNAPAATVIYNAVVSFVESTFSTAFQLVNGIKATPATITTRKQIDAAFAAIAPNSPSATNPSPN